MTPIRSRRRLVRRIVLSALVLASLLAWVPFSLWRARVAAGQFDLTMQQRWLARASWLPGYSAEKAFQRMRLARRLGDLDGFAAGLEQARQAGCEPEVLRREIILQQAQAGDLRALETHLGQWLIDGTDLQAVCEAYATGCIQQYRIDEAFRILTLWQTDFPDDPQPRFLRGRLYEHQFDLVRAEEELQAALALAPRHAPAAFNLARILLSKQDPVAAGQRYRQAADILFEPQPALVGLARCYREQGDYVAARAQLALALARPPARLEEAYRYLGERAETALAQAPAEMAQVEIAAGNDAAALPWLEQALTANPQDWKLRYNYATTLARLGRTADAERESARSAAAQQAFDACNRHLDALKNNPADVEARYQMGCVLLEHLSANQGLVWLNSVLTFAPDHQPTHAKLAEYFSRHASENPNFARLAQEHARAAQGATDEPIDAEVRP